MKRIALLLLLVSPVWGQSPTQTVQLVATVTHKDGTSLSELNAADLAIREGRGGGIIEAVRKFTGAMHYCVVIDRSGSQHEVGKKLVDASLEVLKRVPRPGVDVGYVIAFNDHVEHTQASSSPRQLMDYVNRLSSPHSGSALYDAIVACSSLLEKAPEDSLRVMFLLGDGAHNATPMRLEAAMQAAIKAHAKIFTFYSADPNNGREQKPKILKRFAENTGGRAYKSSDPVAVPGQVQEIRRLLDSQFILRYRPSIWPAHGKLRKLTVKSAKGILATLPKEHAAATLQTPGPSN